MRDRALTLLRSTTQPSLRDGAEARLVAVDLHDLAVAICKKHHVLLSGVLSAKRTRAIAHARHEIMWTIYSQTRLSREEIGELFGVPGSSVLGACELHEQRSGIEHMPKWSKHGRT